MASIQTAPVVVPRVAITYCTQCRWMLRAAYFGQELLSTFGTHIGEIALIPATGGLFTVQLTYMPSENAQKEEVGGGEIKSVLLWDRHTEGGFPETKVLKQLVRDHIDPSRDLGHSDKHGKRKEKEQGQTDSKMPSEGQVQAVPENKTWDKKNPDGMVCEDCK